jgi:hypothetical protein
MRPLLVVAILLVVSLSCFAQDTATSTPPQQGRIVGTVVNDAGEPVPQAMLCWGSYSERGSSSTCGLQSDENGQFDIQVALDANRIYAQRTEAGYWSDDAVEGYKSAQAIRLSAQQPTAHIVVKIGPKPGTANLAVSGVGTGKSIKKFTVHVLVINDRAFFQSVEFRGRSAIPVPSGKDVMLIVQAPGYKRWFYKDADNAGDPILRIQPSEERAIDVELEPDGAQN